MLRCDNPDFKDLVARTAVKAALNNQQTNLTLRKQYPSLPPPSAMPYNPALFRVASAEPQTTMPKSTRAVTQEVFYCDDTESKMSLPTATIDVAAYCDAHQSKENPSKPLITE